LLRRRGARRADRDGRAAPRGRGQTTPQRHAGQRVRAFRLARARRRRRADRGVRRLGAHARRAHRQARRRGDQRPGDSPIYSPRLQRLRRRAGGDLRERQVLRRAVDGATPGGASMSELTMKQFEQEFARLCDEGAYAEAYALVTREAGRFPEWAQGSYYNWRMCTACLMGERDLALRIFGEALAAGHWYDEVGLREDTDLAALQGLPEFERLVAISLERRDQALAQAKPILQTF